MTKSNELDVKYPTFILPDPSHAVRLPHCSVFSEARLRPIHLVHNMNSASFRAEWYLDIWTSDIYSLNASRAWLAVGADRFTKRNDVHTVWPSSWPWGHGYMQRKFGEVVHGWIQLGLSSNRPGSCVLRLRYCLLRRGCRGQCCHICPYLTQSVRCNM